LSARPSALAQRVRRLLHVEQPARPALSAEPARPPGAEQQAPGGEYAQVLAALAALEKQIGRAGREQLKANALAETQLERLTTALDALSAARNQQDAELAALREESRTAQAAARREVALSILPALDGLDAALQTGQQRLEQPVAATPEPSGASDARPTLLQRLFGAPAPEAPAAQPDGGDSALRADLGAWLVGLTFVRQRLLDVLATEGITPIAAEGRHFDPHVHIALQVVPAAEGLPAGTIAAELRRGYRTEDRVLRHAEVAVARGEES
jgi:molecular chaperone GrpE